MIKAPFDVATIRSQFPILQLPSERPVAFLDSASSSQKPEAVIAALADYYRTTNANVHRGVYQLSEQATFEFETGAWARGVVYQRHPSPAKWCLPAILLKLLIWLRTPGVGAICERVM
jgi:hypothetical protein